MRWTYSLGRLLGVEIKVHVTFPLVFLWGIILWGSGWEWSLGSMAYGVAATAALFVAVLFHELGHVAMAQDCGVATHDVILLPIGAVARLTRMPAVYKDQLKVSLAGPFMNLCLMVAANVFVIIGEIEAVNSTGYVVMPNLVEPGWLNFAFYLAVMNLTLMVFNLLPAFPMDGGRALRALLAMKYDWRRAVLVTTILGCLFAAALGVFAYTHKDLFMGMTAGYLFLGAIQKE